MGEIDEFYINAYNLHITLNQCMEKILGELQSDLSFGQYVLLKYILQEKDCKISQKDLSEHGTIKSASVSQFLKSLVKRGYIQHYFAGKDNRCKEIALTEKAIRTIKEIDQKMQESLFDNEADEKRIKKYVEVLISTQAYWRKKEENSHD